MAYALPFVPGIRAHIDRRDHAASAQVAFRFNSFICLALAERLAGGEGLLLIAVLIGVCVPIFNIAAVWPMTRHANTGFLRQLVRNPLIVATVAGLLANVLGLTVPSWATPTLTRIGAASLALGLLAAGAGMKFSTLGTGKVLAVSVLSIRHLFLPLVAWGLVHALRLDATQAVVLMAFSAVPTASSAYVLAARMGYNGPYVAGLVTLSTLLGVLSLPFALALPR
jgi:malonate transporter